MSTLSTFELGNSIFGNSDSTRQTFGLLCVYLSSELWELSVREREPFYQHDSAYPAFNRQRIVTPRKNVLSGPPVPSPSGAEAIVSDR